MLRPRKYLSWSQLLLWEGSPIRYIKSYLYNDGGFSNDGVRFGKEIADALENDEETGDLLKDFLLAKLPRVGKDFDRTRRNTICGVPILIKIDNATTTLSRFIEYKTGAEKTWDQFKAQKSADEGQICFYATFIYFLTGKIPEAKLVFAPTRRNKTTDKIEPTGEVFVYEVEIKLVNILKMAERMKKAWKGIGLAITKELI